MLGIALRRGYVGAVVDAVASIRAAVSNLITADVHGYELLDDQGAQMGVLKVIDDQSGGYLGIYHVYDGLGGPPFHFGIYLAHSDNLETWTRLVKLKTNGALPNIGQRLDGSFVGAWMSQTVSPYQVELRRYTSRANLLAASSSDSITLPITLATAGGEEGTPGFASIEDPMSIAFYYHNGMTNRDHNGLGTLTGWSGTSYTSWITGTAAWDAPVLALDSFVAVAGMDFVTYLGSTLTFVGSQIASGAFFENYWDGSVAVQQTITTDAGSGDLDALRVSVVKHPTLAGRHVAYCCMYIHDDRGLATAPEAPGEAWWYKLLPT